MHNVKSLTVKNYLDTDGRKELKSMLKKLDMRLWTGFIYWVHVDIHFVWWQQLYGKFVIKIHKDVCEYIYIYNILFCVPWNKQHGNGTKFCDFVRWISR